MISLFIHLIRSYFKPKQGPSQSAAIEYPDAFGGISDLTLRDFTGTVTNLCELQSYGLINNCIYFSFDVVVGNKQLKIGDHVTVNCSRHKSTDGFVSSQVRLCHTNWDEKNVLCENNDDDYWFLIQNIESEILENHEGMITELYDSGGMIDKTIKFCIKDCNEDGFLPDVSDLVIASVVEWKSEKIAVSWQPKVTKKVEGTVTAHELGIGIINDDIVYFIKSCHCDFPISVGQKVWANVVENSCSPHVMHRAFSLVPYSLQDVPCNKPYVNETQDLYINGDLDFSELNLGECKEIRFTVRNNGENPLNICDIRFKKQDKKCQFLVQSIIKRNLVPNSEISVVISCKASLVGRDMDVLIFEFEDFLLKRDVNVTVIDENEMILRPTAPYYKSKNLKNMNLRMNENRVIIPGQKIVNPKANFEGYGPSYTVPNKLRSAVEEKRNIVETAPVLLEELHLENYCKRFSCLLHLEEIQTTIDMTEFDMTEICLQRRGSFLVLEVPGLAEGRPSLLVGDKAMLYPPNGSLGYEYEGYIHEVLKNEVCLKFHPDFHAEYNGTTFNVYFIVNRSNFKRCHLCIRHVYNSSRFILYPKYVRCKSPLVDVVLNGGKTSKVIEWKNSLLNVQQKLAVQRILRAQCRPLPYIIFGPPGTGKTVTVVEAVLQVFYTFENARILICTPSNSAADLISERLIASKFIGKRDLVRMNSYQRRVDTIPDFVKPYCLDKSKILDIIEFPIIVSTCSTAGSLYDTKMDPDHFTHVFIDEAGQLTEPECMIAVGIISTHSNGSLVMAGDPKQLGPVLQSSLAKTYGLEISYLERLIHSPPYARDETKFQNFNNYNPQLVTMLVDCYRMHPAILQYPSETFYYSQMKCNVPEERHHLLSELCILPKKGFPIIFHGVQGIEEREESSPSWFNSAEIVAVTNYLRELYANGLSSSDIGIITPYKKQVEKIRLYLSACSMQSCKIGSVEEFQGQEKRVIILSTVRSQETYIQHDIVHHLGFLCSLKRFNVAVTRAKEVLIIVGNTRVLSLDDCWKTFIRYCNVNGAYTGWTPSPQTD